MLNESSPLKKAPSIIERANVHVSGQGTRALLFSHGFGIDQRMWRYVAPHFESDWRVVLHDLIGSGNSDRLQYSRARYRTLDGYADDVLQICEALDLPRVVLVGHSISAMAAIKAANRDAARIEGLILIVPSPRFLNDADYIGGFEPRDVEALLQLLGSDLNGWAQQIAPIAMANSERPELTAEIARSFAAMDPTIAEHFAETIFYSDSRQDAARCTTPALILQCTDDKMAPLSAGRCLSQLMPNSTFEPIDASGHFPQLSAPDRIVPIMRRFLTERVSAG